MATAENSTLSICIPRVDEWVTDDYIRRIFGEVLLDGTEEKMEDGRSIDPIEKVDLLVRQNERGETYKRAFVHFHNWHLLKSKSAETIWRKINDGETVKVMHAKPSYWKFSLNRVPRPQHHARNAMPVENTRTSAFIVE